MLIPIPPSTRLHIGSHILAGDLLTQECSRFGSRPIVVADEALKKILTDKIARQLQAELICIPSGEKAKTREIKQQIEDRLLQAGYGRDTVIVAIGGGTTTDVVGLIASTYLRGVPLILIPTTLLGMVDAAIGGKTGINTPFGKNMIGTIYPPKAILCDFEVLHTLPGQERLNGMAEILKMGLIADPVILDLASQTDRFEELVIRAIQGKIAIIEQDLLEGGRRRVLNFGHTIGHALEAVSRYEMPHGLAVAIGSMASCHLSMTLGYLSSHDFDQALRHYQIFFSLKLPKNYCREHLIQAMRSDKKKIMSAIRFVLIDRLGHALPFDQEYCRPVSEDELQETLSWMEERFG